MSKAELKLDWCSHEAAKYACEHWHYSKCVPAGKMVKIGVWESNIFIGCVLFSWGANRNIGSPYGLQMTQVCELVRIALNKHQNSVSRIIAIAIKLLNKQSPKLMLIVSYADQNQNHHGGIYQASNWIYCGETGKTTNSDAGNRRVKMPNGDLLHMRSYSSKYGNTPLSSLGAIYIALDKAKHKYLYPLTQEMRDKIEPLRKPYPKPAL